MIDKRVLVGVWWNGEQITMTRNCYVLRNDPRILNTIINWNYRQSYNLAFTNESVSAG